MKKFFISLLFVIAGSAMWWGLSNIVQLSIKKWDAKFDTVLRHQLSLSGISNKNILSSVNEIKSDGQGEYVFRRLSLKGLDKNKIVGLSQALEQSGAEVKVSNVKSKHFLIVRRGERLYQEITITP